MQIHIKDFGLSPYREIWDLQKSLFLSLIEKKKRGEEITDENVLLGEHNPVYTLGFHGNASNLLFDESILSKQGIECIRIERGGDITYHGPGQMIAYPIIDLEKHNLGVKQYMGLLEDCVIELLEIYDVRGEKVDGATGVWIDAGTSRERKICAMGIKCSRYVTMHGLALNVNTDMSAFSAINPCGFVDKGVTSLAKETGMELDMAMVKKQFSDILLRALE
ncbi:MAG: lipoyl(octanoyl) transferase LipB [Muribaculaceae bacterium]|nr:lipoyl(octanoyl) transferase LipB [Muribaculaceae bacterium]